MEHRDNYLIQVQQAKAWFLRYDAQALIRKLKLESDGEYLYTKMLCKPYRISLHTGDVQRREETWVETNNHGEVMTLLDLVCDSREDRFLTGNWENMTTFGLRFHQNLMGTSADPFARAIQENVAGFRRACGRLEATYAPGGDMAFALELFDGLKIAIQFWEGDEEFAPRVRYLWDSNALMYLKYETMWFAIGMMQRRILQEMKSL